MVNFQPEWVAGLLQNGWQVCSRIYILARKSLFTLSTYRKDLLEKFPERYFEAYKELLIPFADSRMGRAHYREIVKYLKQMKKIKGLGEQLRQLVDLLKTKYANRPAFLDEIEGI